MAETQVERKPRSQSRRLQTVAATRVSSDELAQLRGVAGRHGLSVSNYLRALVLAAIESDQPSAARAATTADPGRIQIRVVTVPHG